MIRLFKTLIRYIFFMLGFPFGMVSQRAAENARTQIRSAITLMDQEQISEALALLDKAAQLDPTNVTVPYEKAYAHSLRQEYDRVLALLEPILDHADAQEVFFDLFGKACEATGQPEKARQTYERGLQRFPNAERLRAKCF